MDAPKSLRRAEVLEERRDMLRSRDRVQPLREWAESLQARRDTVVPFIDPADAAADASVLILLEAPGPMANSENPRPGSGFISSDNDDETAANCWRARDAADLDENRAMVWNLVPWYLGPASVKPTAKDRREGALALVELMRELGDLRVVILCGRYAQRGWHEHVGVLGGDLRVLETWHPSPLSLWRPERRGHFENTMRVAAQSTADR